MILKFNKEARQEYQPCSARIDGAGWESKTSFRAGA